MIADIRSCREVTLSPDGQTIAYTLRIPGGADDSPGKFWTELHTVKVDGSEKRGYVTKPNSAYNIQWAKDGESIFFLARRKAIDANTQIYEIDLRGGEAQQISHHSTSILGFQLHPEGNKIVFSATDDLTAQEKADQRKGNDWIVYGENQHFTRLHFLNLDNGSISKGYKENLHVASYVWANQGQKVVFRAAPSPGTDDGMMAVRLYTLDGPGATPKLLCNTEGKLGYMDASPDGSTLLFSGATDISDPLAQSLFSVSISGGKPKNLTEGMEASVLMYSWINDQKAIVQFAEGVYSSLYEVTVSSGKRKEIYNKGYIIRGFDCHPASGTLAFSASSPAHPVEVMVGEIGKSDFKRLTISNPELENVKLGQQQAINWKAEDGMNIEGILTLPIGYKKGKKYPLLLQIHGGPEGISSHGWSTNALYPVQWYASKGYIVLQPNYRGSQGRGVAFAKADHKDLGGKEFDDVLSGVDALIEQGLVDPEKVGTGGFSYGGYFSAWAATKHSQRFKAAVVGAGISNWISFTGTTDIIQENSIVHWNLWWYDHMEMVWDRSPMAHLNNAQTPTLVVHGERDLRVPLGQGQELYNGLKLKAVPASMVVYRRQPHGVRERSAQIDYMNRTIEWFNTHIQP